MALLLAVAACGHRGAGLDVDSLQLDGGQRDRDVARVWLAPSSHLPPRPRVVALTDRLAIAATGAGTVAAKARILLLAARLRERLWRFDRTATDGREAAELYDGAATAQLGSAGACQADLRRARLLAELGHSASTGYRQAYLALRRQSAAKGSADGGQGCLTALERLLSVGAAFRPSEAELSRLEQQADAAVAPGGSGTMPPGTAAQAANSAANAGGHGRQREIVIMPDPAMISTDHARLTAVQPYSSRFGGRVVLELNAPVRYQVGQLAPDADAGKGHRVYVDLLGARMRKLPKQLAATGLISGVRLGKRKAGVRVVVDLTAEAFRRVFYLPNPFRVIVDLSTRSPAAAAPAAAGGKRVVRRVALDPGHGGWDDGAVGPTGLREKDVALDIAHRAAPAVATELGIETMLTRDTDTYIPLEERTARANGFGADLFISIHCNATEDGRASGHEVFILDPSRELDKRALQVAARENQSALKHPGGDLSKLDKQLSTIAAGLEVADTTQRSWLFAGLLRKSTSASMRERYGKVPDHGTKTAGFFVLLGADMPAALFETAFISNPEDEGHLATADYRQKLADSIANAVRAYRDGRR